MIDDREEIRGRDVGIGKQAFEIVHRHHRHVRFLEDRHPFGGGFGLEDARQFGIDHIDIGGTAGERRKFRMDAKVVNRGPAGEYNPWPGLPAIRRIFVRGLHPLTYGNAMGIGMADVTTDRLARQIDWEPTRVNALSASVPSRIRLPTHFSDDRASLRWVSATAGKADPNRVTFGWIRNTLALDRLAISENLRGEIDALPHIVVEGSFEVIWDDDGNLVSPFRSVGSE